MWHWAVVVQATSPGGKTRGKQMPLSGTRTANADWTMEQLPTSGQVGPVPDPVQHANGAPAAVQMRAGSQPPQGRPSLPAGPVVQVSPLYGPPTHVLVPPQPLPGQSAGIPQGSPM